MALGTNFLRSEFQSNNGVYYRINIYDSTDALGPGLATFLVDDNGFTLTYKGKGKERYDNIKESNVTIGMFFDVDGASAKPDEFLNALQTSEQGRFKIEILRSDDDTIYSTYWLGIVLADILTINDQSGPSLAKIKATCGLALMKDIPFNRDVYNGDFGSDTSLYTFSNIVTNFLRLYTGGHADFFASGAIYWYEMTHWYEDTMPAPSASNSPWGLSAIYPNAFNDIRYNDGEPEQKTPISAYDALQSILDCWGCRIFQTGGNWWVVHHDMYRNDTSLHYYRIMSKVSATPIFSGTLSTFNTFFEVDNVGEIDNNDIHGIKLAGGTETYYPPLRKTRAVYSNWTDAGILGTFQEDVNPYFTDAILETTLSDIGYVEAVGNAFINISHNVRIKRVSGAPDPLDSALTQNSDYIQIVYMLKIGSYYYNNYTGEWTTTPTSIVIPVMVALYQFWGEGGIEVWQNVQISVSTAEIPVSGELEYAVAFIQGNPYTDTGNTSGTSTYDLQILAHTSDNPSRIQYTIDGENSFERSFLTEDQDSSANEVVDLGKMRIGDGPGTSAPYWGRIRVSNGTSFANEVEESWQAWETGTEDRITQILTEQNYAGQRDFTPKKTLRFQIKNLKPYTMLQAIIDNTDTTDTKYVCNGFKLIANTDEVEGEYWLARSDYEGLAFTFVDLEEYGFNPSPGEWFY